MLGSVTSCALRGIDAFRVDVEVVVAPGNLPSYHVVGLPATSVREAAVRIRSSLEHTGVGVPKKKITVNLAPADRRKDGAAFDLPIALAVLAAEGTLASERLAGLLILGELGLDGALRPVRGALAAAMLARRLGLRGVILPAASAAEAAEVRDLEVYGAEHIGDVLRMLEGAGPLLRCQPLSFEDRLAAAVGPDLSDVRGQETARLALEIAVAGGHNLLMVGPPGIGKTMLARRIPSILPPLARDEALETTQIYSSVGLARGLMVERPFRAPHHSISLPALVGGGSPPRAGEISLAHNGVLFLDELPEFGKPALEALRQPLEDRRIAIGRAHGTIEVPASFLLAAAANPCPCGYLGSSLRSCSCSLGMIERYRARLSGPLLDRIDLQLYVETVTLAEMRGGPPGEPSARVRERVVEARARQRRRLASHGVRLNAEMSSAALRATCSLDRAGERVLERLVEVRHGMSGRAIDRVIRVARTIADLDGRDQIAAECLLDAAGYRGLDSLAQAEVQRWGQVRPAAVT